MHLVHQWPPKLNNKRYPSASRKAAQWQKKSHTDHDELRQNTKDNTKLESREDEPAGLNVPKTEESTKGELNITTVGLPKRVHARTFKCKIC